tara:strand:- start:36556 stop:36720 length:165 start_codon:yes stop_codon:yes gene_type:complete
LSNEAGVNDNALVLYVFFLRTYSLGEIILLSYSLFNKKAIVGMGIRWFLVLRDV